MARQLIELATRNIKYARAYTSQLLEDVQPDEWFKMPKGEISHLAWQVGHLAMAQYGLTMLRLRGKEPEDQEIISNSFFRTFKKGTRPSFNPDEYPPIDEILSVFQRVYETALVELENYEAEDLQESLPEPHALFENKLGSVFFCSQHEMMHAGQIGLLRRELGKEPVR